MFIGSFFMDVCTHFECYDVYPCIFFVCTDQNDAQNELYHAQIGIASFSPHFPNDDDKTYGRHNLETKLSKFSLSTCTLTFHKNG